MMAPSQPPDQTIRLSGYDAMFVLGDCYQHGVGVPKDQQEALRWYRKAAERGHTQAKKLLAQLAP